MTTTTEKLATVAKEFAEAFITDKRDDGKKFTKLRDGSPQWMTDAVHAAHGDIMPDDWIFDQCDSIARSLTEYEPERWEDAAHDIADGLVDVYNNDRARWLAIHLDFGAIVDEAVEELGCEGGIYDRIGIGQYRFLSSMVGALVNAITEEAERREE